MNHCKDKIIERQLTVKYSPQQNGVAEREKRTIVEMAQNMLEGKGMLKNYRQNLSIHQYTYSTGHRRKLLEPFEAWNKRKSQVDHMKVFGCITYPLKKSQNKDKFKNKGERLVLNGYSEESTGYRLLNPSNGKLIVSSDMILDEMAAWNWEEDSSHATTSNDILHLMSTQINTLGPIDLPQSSDLISAPSTSNSSNEDSSSDSESII